MGSALTHPQGILRISFIVSFLLHIVLLIGFQKAFPIHWGPGDFKTYQVELLRPPVKDLDINNELLENGDIEQARQEREIPQDTDQETISLDTEDIRYVGYARQIKESILRQWRYPPEARENLMEGKLLVIFSLNQGGEMTKLDILTPSGYEILDDEAVKAVQRSSPFPPFPDHITVMRLNIKATFDYRLTIQRPTDKKTSPSSS